MWRFGSAPRVDGNVVRVRWVIADGYYLYRQKIDVKAESPDLVRCGPDAAAGHAQDRSLSRHPGDLYASRSKPPCPITRFDAGAHPLQIKVTYQGCAEAGLCYPAHHQGDFPDSAAQPPPSPRRPTPGKAWPFLAARVRLSARRVGAAQGTQARPSGGMNDSGRCASPVPRWWCWSGIWAGTQVPFDSQGLAEPPRRCGARGRGQRPESQRFRAMRMRRPHPGEIPDAAARTSRSRISYGQSHLDHVLGAVSPWSSTSGPPGAHPAAAKYRCSRPCTPNGPAAT